MQIINNPVKKLDETLSNIEKGMIVLSNSPQKEQSKTKVIINDMSSELTKLKEQIRLLKQPLVKEMRKTESTLKEELDSHGDRAYDFARIRYATSNLRSFDELTAIIFANTLSDFFESKGIENHEWVNFTY